MATSSECLRPNTLQYRAIFIGKGGRGRGGVGKGGTGRGGVGKGGTRRGGTEKEGTGRRGVGKGGRKEGKKKEVIRKTQYHILQTYQFQEAFWSGIVVTSLISEVELAHFIHASVSEGHEPAD